MPLRQRLAQMPIQESIIVGNDSYAFQRDPITGRAESLGRGSFGVVYLVNQEIDTTARYAAKILHPALPAIAQLETNWARLQRLEHPNLVRYFHAEMCTNIGRVVVIMEYCSLGNLEQCLTRLRRNPAHPAPPPKALRGCTRDILLGLHHLHTQRIVHTDLKPSNILLAPSEGGGVVLKLADMDDHVGILSSVTGSEIRTTRGTVRYMAPEMFRLAAQWDVEERIGRKLDVWSAGVVVVEMARGVRPLRLIKMDKGRPVETDWLEVTADTRAYAIMDFMLNHGVPVVLDGVLRGFAGLPRCFREIGADRPTAEELLRDPWLADESDGDTGQWWLGDEEL